MTTQDADKKYELGLELEEANDSFVAAYNRYSAASFDPMASPDLLATLWSDRVKAERARDEIARKMGAI